MAMGTNDQSRIRTRNSKRDAAIYGFAGAMFALVSVMTFSSVDAWYMVVGSCLIAIAAVVWVAKAIIALRQGDAAPSEIHNTAGHDADVKVQDGATFTVVKRSSPAAGQSSHYWLGDNGQEIDLTQEEAARLS
ncbi:hypothetical protein ACX80L_15895 [Arthrobacter sp. MDT1-48-3]